MNVGEAEERVGDGIGGRLMGIDVVMTALC